MSTKPKFKLEVFEGPLDLLLHLITKHKLNIFDIEITELLDQYLAYLDEYRKADMEIAGEFLEMAARLIYIKTVSLLPKTEEAEKEKKALTGDLIEYSLCKKMCAKLKERYLGGEIFVRKMGKYNFSQKYDRYHDSTELTNAYLSLGKRPDVQKAKLIAEKKVRSTIAAKPVSVLSKVIFLLKNLYKYGTCEMSRLYEGLYTKSARVAMFLAILELTRNGRILISDDNTELRLKENRYKRRAVHN